MADYLDRCVTTLETLASACLKSQNEETWVSPEEIRELTKVVVQPEILDWLVKLGYAERRRYKYRTRLPE